MKPGAVRLNMADAERAQAFYEETIGLQLLGQDGPIRRLGANGTVVVELMDAPGAPRRPRHTTGLFHLAILLPSRLDLALALHRIARSGWSLTGASDHLVSEALYLNDPEGNGIEIYRDRPREGWSYAGGALRMSTLPLDLDGVTAELGGAEAESNGVPPGTRIGHVHLNVDDLDRAEAFYCGLLGFEVTVRGYPGALFVSTGAYHHDLGLNTWAGEGAPPPPPGALGLNRFELLSDDQHAEELERRLAGAGHEPEAGDDGILVTDPSGNAILLRTR
jgi:catechol 2,3-dioxygenase